MISRPLLGVCLGAFISACGSTVARGEEEPLLAGLLSWSKMPNGRDIAMVYPDGASRAHLEGRGAARCFISDRWTLEHCTVVSSNPPDAGFGEAVVQLASRFQLSRTQKDARAKPGAVVVLPFQFRLPDLR